LKAALLLDEAHGLPKYNICHSSAPFAEDLLGFDSGKKERFLGESTLE